MNRKDFQQLSRMRLAEARTLLKQKHYAGAYHLAGYAIECALKACIAKQTQRSEFPDKKRVDDSYTHDLERLVHLAGLDLKTAKQNSQAFEDNWLIVKAWKETSRYQQQTRNGAIALLRAISARKDGVLSWIKKYW